MLQPPKLNQSLASLAHQKLEELIVTLELKPGSVWSEQSLAEVVEIGRTPVREAIKRLEADRLIVTVPRHGVRISEINLYEQLQVVELRSHLERIISFYAASRALPDERQKLVAMAIAIEAAVGKDDILLYLRSVFIANQFIVQCARNPFVAKAITPLFGLSRRFYYRYHDELENLEDVCKLHATRARAVSVGDAAASEQAAAALMKDVEDFTRALFLRDFGET